jgi:choloylglycine hydrolase
MNRTKRRQSLGHLAGILALTATSGLLACTTFQIPQSPTKVMAKSFDWNHDTGLVLVNKHGVSKTALTLSSADTPASWVSRYGSLTFNQVGREFPLGGINEKGLAIEIMWLDSSVYPAASATPALNEMQWIQYILDGASTLEDAITLAQAVRVSDVFAKVHYMACDASGACGTFEYIAGKLTVHNGQTLPVPTLTNDTYQDSLAFLDQHVGFGGTLPIPQSYASLDRFAQASWRVQTYAPSSDGSAIDYAFATLDRVAQGDYSKWNMVYEPTAGKAHFRTLRAHGVKDIDLHAFDFSCRANVKMLDINDAATGDVVSAFADYTQEANTGIATEATTDYVQVLPPGSIQALANYPQSSRCLE